MAASVENNVNRIISGSDWTSPWETPFTVLGNKLVELGEITEQEVENGFLIDYCSSNDTMVGLLPDVVFDESPIDSETGEEIVSGNPEENGGVITYWKVNRVHNVRILNSIDKTFEYMRKLDRNNSVIPLEDTYFFRGIRTWHPRQLKTWIVQLTEQAFVDIDKTRDPIHDLPLVGSDWETFQIDFQTQLDDYHAAEKAAFQEAKDWGSSFGYAMTLILDKDVEAFKINGKILSDNLDLPEKDDLNFEVE